jgi:hypothetical protein
MSLDRAGRIDSLIAFVPGWTGLTTSGFAPEGTRSTVNDSPAIVLSQTAQSHREGHAPARRPRANFNALLQDAGVR